MEICVLGQMADNLVLEWRNRGISVTILSENQYQSILEDGSSNADIIVIRSPFRLTAGMISACRRLKWIIRAGSGLDNIDLDAANRKGITLYTTPVSGTAVAELAIGLCLAVARSIPFQDRAIREGEWHKWETCGSELWGKSIGIVGLGRIGQRIACISEAFGMRTLGYNGPNRMRPLADLPKPSIIEFENLDDLLHQANYLVLCCRLTEQTRSMIGRREISLLPAGSAVINVARGEIVDTKALADALDQKHLAGAGLDVVTGEPNIPIWIRMKEKVIITPHIGAQTVETHQRIASAVDRIVISLHNEYLGATE